MFGQRSRGIQFFNKLENKARRDKAKMKGKGCNLFGVADKSQTCSHAIRCWFAFFSCISWILAIAQGCHLQARVPGNARQGSMTCHAPPTRALILSHYAKFRVKWAWLAENPTVIQCELSKSISLDEGPSARVWLRIGGGRVQEPLFQ